LAFPQEQVRIGALFFDRVDALLDGIREEVLGQLAALGNDRRFAGTQDGAIGSGERRSLEFLVKRQELPDEGFAGGRNLNRDSRTHRTSLFRVGFTSFTQFPPQRHQRS
jgi:hypothetical protein